MKPRVIALVVWAGEFAMLYHLSRQGDLSLHLMLITLGACMVLFSVVFAAGRKVRLAMLSLSSLVIAAGFVSWFLEAEGHALAIALFMAVYIILVAKVFYNVLH